jgi:hypothetical protein
MVKSCSCRAFLFYFLCLSPSSPGLARFIYMTLALSVARVKLFGYSCYMSLTLSVARFFFHATCSTNNKVDFKMVTAILYPTHVLLWLTAWCNGRKQKTTIFGGRRPQRGRNNREALSIEAFFYLVKRCDSWAHNLRAYSSYDL